jgi:hypothetical protein
MVEEAGVAAENPPTLGKQLVKFITCGCESWSDEFVPAHVEHVYQKIIRL